MNTERDKFLTEAMGECWHDLIWDEWRGRYIQCSLCDLDVEDTYDDYSCHYHDKYNTDFSSWKGFGKLWEWAQQQDWWFDTVRWDFYVDEDGITNGANFIQESLVNPNAFANAVYDYLKAQG